MDSLDHARETLDTMLGYLGFAATVSADRATSTLHVTASPPDDARIKCISLSPR